MNNKYYDESDQVGIIYDLLPHLSNEFKEALLKQESDYLLNFNFIIFDVTNKEYK